MTINDVLIEAEKYQIMVLLYLVLVPLSSFLYNALCESKTRLQAPHKYVYSILIYSAALPGAIGFALTTYTLFFLRVSLLEVNFTFYFLTMISMVVSFIIISKGTDLAKISGFDRIIGLFTLMALTFFCILMLMKVRIFVGFFASFEYLVIGALVVFVLLKVSAAKLFGNSKKEDG